MGEVKRRPVFPPRGFITLYTEETLSGARNQNDAGRRDDAMAGCATVAVRYPISPLAGTTIMSTAVLQFGIRVILRVLNLVIYQVQ